MKGNNSVEILLDFSPNIVVAALDRCGYKTVTSLVEPSSPNFEIVHKTYKEYIYRVITLMLVLKKRNVCLDLVNKIARLVC